MSGLNYFVLFVVLAFLAFGRNFAQTLSEKGDGNTQNVYTELEQLRMDVEKLNKTYQILSRNISELGNSFQKSHANAGAGVADCPNSWSSYGGSCYFFSRDKTSWADATVICNALGAHLVEIGDSSEDNYIYQHARGYQAWIGLTDIEEEGKFKWMTSHTGFTYSHWYLAQPNHMTSNENCVVVNSKHSALLRGIRPSSGISVTYNTPSRSMMAEGVPNVLEAGVINPVVKVITIYVKGGLGNPFLLVDSRYMDWGQDGCGILALIDISR